ncbi:DUF2877 domain-containing protein [Alkaliphilus peptidifermentans]|uniref:DUF2877 domain-containing protein n=1 Tax=Alkaliphilus peptidifermentans DSM 18978 TaxID=1120976 RepID=A0A1G5ID20_9FIRM|nr:DUF2877 domain-containing protein [Alkaliphilus peptidifermentans]SCY73449.1 Protein of unknown function [Alkaliphilus peptidifermentans DSM 18978]
MKAIRMCHHTKELIDNEMKINGKIHSIFNRVLNIITPDDKLISIVSSQVPIPPRGIVLELPSQNSFHSLNFNPGMKVTINKQYLEAADGKFQLNLSEALVWDSRPDSTFDKAQDVDFKKKLELFREALVSEGNFNGIAPIFAKLEKQLTNRSNNDEILYNHYCYFIERRMLKLLDSIINNNTEGARKAAKEIVGFGPGLTPSADDFLTGLIIAMVYCTIYLAENVEKIYKIAESLVEGVEFRTTKISAEMLTFASNGEVSENVKQLMISLFSVSKPEDLNNPLKSVINNGETSGTDLAAGIYIGCLLSNELWRGRGAFNEY